jgi:hypothetical protein
MREDCGSKPAQAKKLVRPYLEKTLHKKRADGVARGAGPDFKPQYHKKKVKIIGMSSLGNHFANSCKYKQVST